jgi:hypothetical protein
VSQSHNRALNGGGSEDMGVRVIDPNSWTEKTMQNVLQRLCVALAVEKI